MNLVRAIAAAILAVIVVHSGALDVAAQGPAAPQLPAGESSPRPTGAAPPPAVTATDSLPTRVEGERLSQVIENGVPILIIEGVRIQHGSVFLTGDRGRYDRQSGRAFVDGSVKVVDGGTTITGDHGTYDIATGLATISGDVHIRRQDLEVRAPRATYERATRMSRLGGGVQVIDSKRKVEADSVVYWAREDRALAIGRVRIDEGGEEPAILRGDVADYRRRAGDLQLLERASITLEEGGTPIDVMARDLRFRQEGKEVVAEGDVIVKQKNSEALAENALFRRDEHWALLTGSPLARDPFGEVRGDSLELGFDQGELRRLIARGHARSVYRQPLPEGDDEVMYLRGHVLRVEIEDGQAKEIEVEGGAESVVIPGSRERLESGAIRNQASADSIRVIMASGRAERAMLEGQANGLYLYRQSPGDTVSAAPARPISANPGPRDTTSAMAPADTSLTLGAPADTSLAGLLSSAADSLVFGGPAPADSLVQSIRYQADNIEYLVERSEILLEDHAELFHDNLHLTAGHVRFNASDRTLLATRTPVLEDGDQTLEGDAMTYDFTPRQGSVMHGRTTFERGLYSGRRLFRASDGSLHVTGADYTTCDRNPPHYHFAGQRMKIYLDDKVVTEPVGLFIYRIPILALPFYIFPIKRGRHSGFLLPQVEFGFSQTTGRFVHNAGYYWVMNDYSDLKSWVDVQEISPFFIGNVDVRYALRYRLAGDMTTKFTLGEGKEQWDVRGSHRQDLGQRRTLRANTNFLSDREFRRDIQGQFANDRLSTQLRSNLSYEKSWSTQSLRVTTERTQNLQNAAGETEQGAGRVTGLFPTLAYSFFDRPIGRPADEKGRGGRWPFLASSHYSFSGDYRRTFDTQREPDIYLQSASARTTLADRRQLAMLNLGPTLSVNSTVVERREQADTAGVLQPVGGRFVSGQWSTAMDLQTELYGLFAPALGPFHGFRHIMTPRTSLTYTDSFDSEGGRESPPPSSTVGFSLSNRVETRLPGEGQALRRVPDFLVVNLSTNYDLSNRTEHRFSPIQMDARLEPGLGRDFQMDYNLTYDPYDRRPVRYDTSTRFALVRTGRGKGAAPTGEGAATGAGEGGGGEDEEGAEDLSGTGAGEGGGAYAGAATSSAEQAAREAAVSGDLFPRAFSLSGTLSFAGGGGGDKTLQSTLTSSFRLSPKWSVEYYLSYDLAEHEVVRQHYNVVRDLHCWQAQFRRTFETGRWEYYFRISIKDLPQIFYEKGRGRTGFTQPF